MQHTTAKSAAKSAAKKPAVKKARVDCLPTVVSEAEDIPLLEISLADDSGWRRLNRDAVAKRVNSWLKDGNYNRGVMGNLVR